jgi:hypothetical protein
MARSINMISISLFNSQCANVDAYDMESCARAVREHSADRPSRSLAATLGTMRNASNEATVIRVARAGSIGRISPSNVIFRAGGDPTSGMKWSILTPGCSSFSCVQSTSRMISAVVFAKRTQPPSKSKLQKSLGQDFVARPWLETQKRAGIGWYTTGSGQRRRVRQKEVEGQLMIKSDWGARRRSPDPGTTRGPWTRQGS